MILIYVLITLCVVNTLVFATEQSCFLDPTCNTVNDKYGGLGCDANNNATCRFCGGTGPYANIPCGQLSGCCIYKCPYKVPYKAVRTFQLHNHCGYDLYVGVIGVNNSNGKHWGPRQGGFKLPANKTESIYIGSHWSGRIWPRTNCFQNTSSGKFQCDSGDCSSDVNNNGINGTCCGDIKCSSAKGTSLAEFSLLTNRNSTNTDTYDVSLVDGYTIPMSVTPYDNDTSCGGNGTYYCKPSYINEFDVANKCPPELRWNGTGKYHNMQFCASICSGINNAQLRERTSFINSWANGANAIGASGVNYTKTHHGPMSTFLCCECTSNGGNCTSNPCSFGCSPHLSTSPVNKMCTLKSGTGLPDWPYSQSAGFDTINYAQIFKMNSPTAYSWQFDDPTSTFRCRNTNYRIDFCIPQSIQSQGNTTKTKAVATLKIPPYLLWCMFMVFTLYCL